MLGSEGSFETKLDIARAYKYADIGLVSCRWYSTVGGRCSDVQCASIAMDGEFADIELSR